MKMDLFGAIEKHDLHLLIQQLSAGANPNMGSPTTPAWTPLKQAIEEIPDGGPIEAIVLILRSGGLVDGGTEPGNVTPLIVAAINNVYDAVLILLASGADPNARDDEGDTPLLLSQRNKNIRMEAALRLCGASEA